MQRLIQRAWAQLTLVAALVALAVSPAALAQTAGPGTLQLSTAAVTVAQNSGAIRLTVSRTGGSTGAVGVTYRTVNGSAVAGTNFYGVSGTISWGNGDTSAKRILVGLNASPAFSGNRNFSIVLSGATGGATLGTPAATTVTMTGTGGTAASTVALAAASYSVNQTAGSVKLVVNRAGSATAAATVKYATANGSAVSGTNYTAASGTVSWAANDAAAKSVTIPVSTTAFTGTKTFTVTLSAPTGATLGSPVTSTVTITGSGATAASSVALSAATYGVTQSAGSVKVTVNRAGSATAAATVKYATANGSAVAGTHYTAATGTLSWAANDAAAKSVTIPVSTVAYTGSKTFTFTLSAPAGATLGTPTSATVTITGTGTTTGGGTGAAAKLAAKLGKPSRLLVGLGAQGSGDTPSAINAQSLTPDIYERYLVGVGAGDWTTWNSPSGAYVGVVGAQADRWSAVPMYTLYQMAQNGDGNLTPINDTTFMTAYWNNVRIMYQKIAAYGKPALVNLEPDFWGYVQQQNPTNGASKAAKVTINADCATLTNDVKGIAGCMISMARKYASNAYVGFPPSEWGANTVDGVVAFMSQIGAQNADYIVMQTLDRDGGCFEVSPQPSYCSRGGRGWYWDETNTTSPSFAEHLGDAAAYHDGLGGLPLIWWQTPMGVPAAAAGGTSTHYRDNRVHYFLTHPSELTAVGGLGVVFSTGETHQTSILTDGGQFKTLSSAYLAAPAALP